MKKLVWIFAAFAAAGILTACGGGGGGGGGGAPSVVTPTPPPTNPTPPPPPPAAAQAREVRCDSCTAPQIQAFGSIAAEANAGDDIVLTLMLTQAQYDEITEWLARGGNLGNAPTTLCNDVIYQVATRYLDFFGGRNFRGPARPPEAYRDETERGNHRHFSYAHRWAIIRNGITLFADGRQEHGAYLAGGYASLTINVGRQYTNNSRAADSAREAAYAEADRIYEEKLKLDSVARSNASSQYRAAIIPHNQNYRNATAAIRNTLTLAAAAALSLRSAALDAASSAHKTALTTAFGIRRNAIAAAQVPPPDLTKHDSYIINIDRVINNFHATRRALGAALAEPNRINREKRIAAANRFSTGPDPQTGELLFATEEAKAEYFRVVAEANRQLSLVAPAERKAAEDAYYAFDEPYLALYNLYPELYSPLPTEQELRELSTGSGIGWYISEIRTHEHRAAIAAHAAVRVSILAEANRVKQAAINEAERVYSAARTEADRIYNAATQAAQSDYDDAVAESQRVYRAANDEARRVLSVAITPIRQTYYTTLSAIPGLHSLTVAAAERERDAARDEAYRVWRAASSEISQTRNSLYALHRGHRTRHEQLQGAYRAGDVIRVMEKGGQELPVGDYRVIADQHGKKRLARAIALPNGAKANNCNAAPITRQYYIAEGGDNAWRATGRFTSFNMRGILTEKAIIQTDTFLFAHANNLRDLHTEFRAPPITLAGVAIYADSGFRWYNSGETQAHYGKIMGVYPLGGYTSREDTADTDDNAAPLEIYGSASAGKVHSNYYEDSRLQGFAAGVLIRRLLRHDDEWHIRLRQPLAAEEVAAWQFALDNRIPTGDNTGMLSIGYRRNLHTGIDTATCKWRVEF